MIALREGTLYLPELDLWVDSMPRRARGYISHGHADHARPQGLAIATPATAAICEARFARRAEERGTPRDWAFETHAYGEPWIDGAYELELAPAGHVLGSSQLIVRGEGGVFVYTGDFKLEQAFTAEPTAVPRCDTVLMECTYGKPSFVFPDRETIAAEMVGFARETLAAGATPVFYAYSLGKAQEAMAVLGRAGIRLVVHGAVASMAAVYEAFGVALPPYETYDVDAFPGDCAVVWPPGGRAVPKALRGAPVRTAALTGWALAGGTARTRTDVAFALSDHADFPSLVRYVERAQPRKVLLNHGFRECVDHLRRLGVDAEYLDPHRQMTLF